jgi:hypothetical protein
VMANAFKADIHLMTRLALPWLAGATEHLACAAAGGWLTSASSMKALLEEHAGLLGTYRLFCFPPPRLPGRELKGIH